MRIVIADTFSLNMLSAKSPAGYVFAFVPLGSGWTGPAALGCFEAIGDHIHSVVGHEDTARLFSKLLQWDVVYSRENYVFQEHDLLFVGQYTGPRLPEGATELPEGAAVMWWGVKQLHFSAAKGDWVCSIPLKNVR